MKRARRIRIAIITHNYPANSSERKDAGIFVYDFAQELAKYAEVVVFCPDFGGDKERYKKVPVEWFDWGGPRIKFGNWPVFSPLSVFNFFKLFVVGSGKVLRFAEEHKIDYCLACWIIPSSIYAYLIKKNFGIPYGVWALGSDVHKYARLPLLRQISALVLKNAKHRFANSYCLAGMVRKLSGDRCNYLSAVTDFTNVKVEKVDLQKNVFNFLFVGRLEKVKGPDILVRACAELIKKRKDFRVHVLGNGSMRRLLETAVGDYGLAGNVRFYGNSGKGKMAGFMKASDCLLISSRSESMPLALIEAARMGLPTVSTDVGDCKKVIRKYNIGFVSHGTDSVSLARMMLRAMGEGKRFKIRRLKGLKSLAESRSQEKTVRQFYDFLVRSL